MIVQTAKRPMWIAIPATDVPGRVYVEMKIDDDEQRVIVRSGSSRKRLQPFWRAWVAQLVYAHSAISRTSIQVTYGPDTVTVKAVQAADFDKIVRAVGEALGRVRALPQTPLRRIKRQATGSVVASWVRNDFSVFGDGEKPGDRVKRLEQANQDEAKRVTLLPGFVLSAELSWEQAGQCFVVRLGCTQPQKATVVAEVIQLVELQYALAREDRQQKK